MGNHLGIEHGAPNLGPPRNMQDIGVNFTDPASKASVGGSPVYAARFVGDPSKSYKRPGPNHFNGQGYSNRTARGTAVADEPQSQYAVFAGRHYNDGCCFDCTHPQTHARCALPSPAVLTMQRCFTFNTDGNAENDLPNGTANAMGDGTMEAIYFGSSYAPHGKGAGKGPWIGADMENGIYVREQQSSPHRRVLISGGI